MKDASKEQSKKKKKEVILENPPGLYYSKKEPRKALSTYLRNQNKFIVSSMALADRKAMIMIRINAIVSSGIVVFFQYLNESVTYGATMGAILVIGTTTALAFAVFAAKPNGLLLKKIYDGNLKAEYPDLEYNNFLTFNNPSLSEYENSMDKVVGSQELQIGNQVRFHYLMDIYLAKKYRLLDISYNIFLSTFVSIMIVFLITRML